MPLMFSEPPSPPQGAPEWMVTYADMVTLLLTFFVMLASLSEVNREGSYQDLVESVQGRFGIGAAPGTSEGSLRPRNAAMANVAVAARKIRRETLENATDSKDAPSSNLARLLLATIECDLAAGELPATAREALADLASRTTGKTGTIEIRGLAPRDRIEEAIARAQVCRKQLVALGIDGRQLKITAAEREETITSGDAAGKSRQSVTLELYLLETPSP